MIVLLYLDGTMLWTWEALEQLVEDVPVLIAKYVRADGHQQLVSAHRKAVREAKKKKKAR